jgi:hypothetical protein
MQITIFEVIGWVGAAGLLSGYFLFSLGKFDARLWLYHIFNLLSSALLLINAIHTSSGPFTMINSVWCIISVFGIAKSLRSKGKQQ